MYLLSYSLECKPDADNPGMFQSEQLKKQPGFVSLTKPVVQSEIN
jgi:hypothetical protein